MRKFAYALRKFLVIILLHLSSIWPWLELLKRWFGKGLRSLAGIQFVHNLCRGYLLALVGVVAVAVLFVASGRASSWKKE